MKTSRLKNAVNTPLLAAGCFIAPADDNELALFRQALQSGTPLGHYRFKAEIESVLGRGQTE